MTSLCALLGIDIPILCAPTGSVAGPELAVAVSEAGGFGAMGLTWTPQELAAAWVRQVSASTDRPFQVNFALAFEPLALEAVLDAGAPIITFSWGDPTLYVDRCCQAGALVGVQVTNTAGARRALDLGADFLICQGTEAGGHVQSSTPLSRLLPRIVSEAGNVPVAAAGGIADAAAIARVLKMGAQGAILGTRFVATQESRAHDDYKALLLAASGDETALTTCFDIGWPQAPHRVLRNSTLSEWEAHGCPPRGRRPSEGEAVACTESGQAILRYEDTAPQRNMTGAIEAMCLYAGTGVGSVSDIPPAGKLIRRLWSEAAMHMRVYQSA